MSELLPLLFPASAVGLGLTAEVLLNHMRILEKAATTQRICKMDFLDQLDTQIDLSLREIKAKNWLAKSSLAEATISLTTGLLAINTTSPETYHAFLFISIFAAAMALTEGLSFLKHKSIERRFFKNL